MRIALISLFSLLGLCWAQRDLPLEKFHRYELVLASVQESKVGPSVIDPSAVRAAFLAKQGIVALEPADKEPSDRFFLYTEREMLQTDIAEICKAAGARLMSMRPLKLEKLETR